MCPSSRQKVDDKEVLKFGENVSAGMVRSCEGLLAALVPTLGYLDGAMHILSFLVSACSWERRF